jgi:hypothetical protein
MPWDNTNILRTQEFEPHTILKADTDPATMIT